MNGRGHNASLSEQMQEHIKDYIVSRKLKAGDPLPSEGQLADQFGVSRSPVREAVKALQSLGIVEARRGDGLYVREWNLDPMLASLNYGMRISLYTLSELYQIRVMMEMAVIRDVVALIGEDEITELEIIMLQWERAIRAGDPYVKYDEAFHRLIFSVMKNETMLKFFKVFWLAFADFGDSALLAHDEQRVVKEHRAVLDAIKQGDPDETHDKLLQQFAGFQERLDRLVAASDEPAYSA